MNLDTLIETRHTDNLPEIFDSFPVEMEWRRQALRRCVATGDQEFVNAVLMSGDWVVFAMTSETERLAAEKCLLI